MCAFLCALVSRPEGTLPIINIQHLKWQNQEIWILRLIETCVCVCLSCLRLINSSDQLDKCRLRIESKKQELSEVESQMAQFEQNSSTSAKYDWLLLVSPGVIVV